MLYACWVISISSLEAAILDFQLPLALHSMGNRFIEFVNLENIEITFEILQLCCIQAEI